MLESILGSKSCEQVFIFTLARGEGYGTEIAEFYDSGLYAIQNQLNRLEDANILVSKKVGRARVYTFKPRYPFLDELKQLLEKAFQFYPEEIRE